jgi:hypothetical protein
VLVPRAGLELGDSVEGEGIEIFGYGRCWCRGGRRKGRKGRGNTGRDRDGGVWVVRVDRAQTGWTS